MNAKDGIRHPSQEKQPMSLYHYTDLVHLPHILLDGKILPSRADAIPGMRQGLVWLSTNPEWENTATSASAETVPTPVRFKVPNHHGQHWYSLCQYLGADPPALDGMVHDGRRLGGYPEDWRASPHPIPLKHCTLEFPLGIGIGEYPQYIGPIRWQPVTESVRAELVPDHDPRLFRMAELALRQRMSANDRRIAGAPSECRAVALIIDGRQVLISFQLTFKSGYRGYMA